MRYTIQNTFHGTETTTKYDEEDRAHAQDAEVGSPLYQAMRRAHDKLCGSPDCTCSDVWGIRN